MTIQKPDFNQIFASQAPDADKPPVFNNYNGGWGDESRPNNGKPTIKGFNYLQQLNDSKLLWLKQNAILPYDSDTDYPVGTVTLKDGKFQKWDGAEWSDFIEPEDSQITTWSGRTQEAKNKDFVSLHDYCKCDGITDDTDQFMLAVTTAKSENKKLFGFYGTLKLTRDCNIRFLGCDLSGTIIVMHNQALLIIGDTGGSSTYKEQKFGLVKQVQNFSINATNYTFPTVRVMGSKCTNFKFDQVDYLQLYASTDPKTFPADGSIAYCSFSANLVTRIEFNTDPRYAGGVQADGAGSANQWINSNTFHLTRCIAVDIKGSYPHNHNVFYGGCFENGGYTRINIEVGNKNQFVHIRGEGSPVITFGVGTRGNIVSRSWFSDVSNYLIFDNVTDLGELNKVTSVQELESHRIEILNINSNLDASYNGQSGNYGRINPSRRVIKTVAASQIITQTKPFKIMPADILHFYCNSVDASTSRYNVRVYFYDKNGVLVTDLSSDWFYTANFSTLNAAQGYAEGSVISSGGSYFALTSVGREKVGYYSLMLLSSSNPSLARSSVFTVSLLTMRNILQMGITKVSRINEFNYVTSKPTAFIGKVGDVVQGLDTSYRCRLMVETKLTNEAVPATSTVTVSKLVGDGGTGAVLAGDLIGIDLDDNSTHWTTVASLSGYSVTLANALPSGAALGNNVYIARLV